MPHLGSFHHAFKHMSKEKPHHFSLNVDIKWGDLGTISTTISMMATSAATIAIASTRPRLLGERARS